MNVSRSGVWVLAVLLVASTLVAMAAEDRASTSLTLEGRVLTADGSSVVRGASVRLLVYNDTEVLTHVDFTITAEGGNFTFTVPAEDWEAGWNASLLASYTLVGAERELNFTLTAATTQQADVRLPWDRVLGASVKVPEPHVTSARDGIATFVINVTNSGNDTDPLVLWAEPSNSSVQSVFHPRNQTELSPGETELVSLVLSNPGLLPGDYGIELAWRSEWYAGEGGTVDLTWTVLPEVDLVLTSTGVTWRPYPLLEGDDALLNCSVVNAGRDDADLANVTIEVVHPSQGQVFRDRVRVNVPGRGSAVASFPWKAVYSEVAYTLRFEVEHPDDKGSGNNEVEVPMTVGVSNAPPVVTFLSPANGTSVNGTVTVGLRVVDTDTPVEGVHLRIGGGDWIDLPTVAEPTYQWDTTDREDGWYVLEAYATDRYMDGDVTAHHLKVANAGPNHPPEVFIESPKEGDVYDTVIKARGIAFDQDENVKEVRLRIDGGEWTQANGTVRWSANISTDGMGAGRHLLEVQADDGIDPSEIVSVQFRVTELPVTALTMSLEVLPPTTLPSESVEVKGELMYDNGVRVEGLQVRIEGPNGLLVFKTSDLRGIFRLSTVAPGAEDRYEYRASTTDGSGRAASNTTQLRVLKSLDPDLSIKSINLESGRVAVGANVTVSVEVRNLGYAVGNGTLRAWEGDPGTGELIEERNVTVYESISISFVWMPSVKGDRTLTVEVVNVQPADANLSNNRRTQEVEVVDLPDLTVGAITLSNPKPYDNTTFTVTIRADNLGGLNATCTIKLFLDGRETEHLVGTEDVEVKEKGTAYVAFDLKVAKGLHELRAEVVNVYPEDSDPLNNWRTTTFTVVGPFEPPPANTEPPIFGLMTGAQFLTILLVVVAVAVGAMLWLRRGALD